MVYKWVSEFRLWHFDICAFDSFKSFSLSFGWGNILGGIDVTHTCFYLCFVP